MLRIVPLVAALLGGCGILSPNGGIDYDLQPEEYAQDFGNQMGTVPNVPCASDAICKQSPAPQGTTASCDLAAGKCVLGVEVRLVQAVNLSQESGFPSSVANSSAIDHVTVGAVHYWTPKNSLTFDTPPIDVFVGSQSAQKESDSGVVRLGSMSALPAMMLTHCRNGTAGTPDARCDMPLTSDGKSALGTFAKDYKTPFNVLVVAKATLHAGDPIPAGKLDLFVQPTLTFVLLK